MIWWTRISVLYTMTNVTYRVELISAYSFRFQQSCILSHGSAGRESGVGKMVAGGWGYHCSEGITAVRAPGSRKLKGPMRLELAHSCN